MNYRIPVYKVLLVRDSSIGVEGKRPHMLNSQDVRNVVREFIGPTDREHFVVLGLDAKNKVIGINLVSTGTLTSSLVHPREVMKPLILWSAAAFIVAHNHPSGDPTPSAEDKTITYRLKDCGEVFGMKLLDHVVVGEEGRYFSFADNGIL